MDREDIIIEGDEEQTNTDNNTNNNNYSFLEGMMDNVLKNFYGEDILKNEYVKNSFEAMKNRFKDENGNMDMSKIMGEVQNMNMSEETLQKAREMANNMMNNNSQNNNEEHDDVIIEE